MLKWGILGSGFISNTVIEAIGRSAGSEVALLAGRNADAVATMAQHHGIPRTVTEYEQAIADASIDAVYIGLPNHKHHELAILAAGAGKAILSEKSLTTTMETAHELVGAVRTHGVFFAEGLMYLAHPVIGLLVDVIADGRLGTIRSIDTRYAADIWNVVNPLGRGTIYNLGCYPVSLLHLVMQTAFGPEAFNDRAMHGMGNLTGTHQGTPDGTICDAAMTIRFGNGTLATVQSSDSYGNVSDFAITGDNGVLRFRTNPWLPEPGTNGLTWHPFDQPDTKPAALDIDDAEDAFYHQVQMVERCVAAGLTEAPRPSPRLNDSLEIMALLTDWETACLDHLGVGPTA